MGVGPSAADACAEGVWRGCTLLTAFVDEDGVCAAMQILNRHGAIDLDERMAMWRQELETQPPPPPREIPPEETEHLFVRRWDGVVGLPPPVHNAIGWMLWALAVIILAGMIYTVRPHTRPVAGNAGTHLAVSARR